MFGVTGANYVMNRYADKVCGVLEKVTPINEIYSILVNISKWLGIKIIENQFSDFYKNNIIKTSEAVSSSTFNECCNRLKNSLQETYLHNLNHTNLLIDVEVV